MTVVHDPDRVPVGRTFRATERRRLVRELDRLGRQEDFRRDRRDEAAARLEEVIQERRRVRERIAAIDAADAAEHGR